MEGTDEIQPDPAESDIRHRNFEIRHPKEISSQRMIDGTPKALLWFTVASQNSIISAR